jgi:iron(III) transport system ATP-binding protein
VLVTHDPDEAMRLADRVVLLRAGRVVQAGPVEELYRRPGSLFVARFFSEFDEIEATVEGGRARSVLGDFPAFGHRDGAKVTICIRPSAIRLGKARNGLAARVLSRRFLGESDLVLVAVDGLARPLHARLSPEISAGAGEAIGLDIAREEVMVFGAA